MRCEAENIGSPPLHSSSSPSSWLQWTTTSSPTFQRFTFDPTAQTIARGVRSGDMVGLFVDVEHRNRLAERGPDAVVVDARRPSRKPARRGCRAARSARPRPASTARAGRAAPCAPPRRTSTPAHGRAGGFRRSRRGPSSRPRSERGLSAAPPPERMAMTFLVTRAAPAGRRPSRRRAQAPISSGLLHRSKRQSRPGWAKSIPLWSLTIPLRHVHPAQTNG